ncbi:MAG: thioesterase family protein [Deltaproteobacteria bacterium]|nr:thioesterase family protein [Deltaproteobacteria bacterium]
MQHCLPFSHEIERRVPFYDLDPLQIVWHGNYFNYFEDARQALLAQLGCDLTGYLTGNRYSFPIAKTETKHLHPLRYADAFICKATLVEARTRLVMDFEIRLKESGKRCAIGRTEQVAIKLPEMEILIFLPEEIRQALNCE